MNEYLIQKNTLTEIGDKVRRLSGDDEALSPVEMAEGLENVADEVDTQFDLIQQIKIVLADKAAGVELPELTNPGSASDLAEGMELIDAEGNKVTGTVPVRNDSFGTGINTRAVFDSEDDYVRAYGAVPYDALVRKNTEFEIAIDSSKFGTAASGDVKKGRTFTSRSGVKIEGTYEPLDTSDATATVSDIVNGKSAYVKGNKIEGSVVEVTNSTINGYYPVQTNAPVESYYDSYYTGIRSTGTVLEDMLVRKGTNITGHISASHLGDATAADVAAGKTFTSSAGLKVTGTMQTGTSETWVLTLEDGSTVEKVVYVK